MCQNSMKMRNLVCSLTESIIIYEKKWKLFDNLDWIYSVWDFFFFFWVDIDRKHREWEKREWEAIWDSLGY